MAPARFAWQVARAQDGRWLRYRSHPRRLRPQTVCGSQRTRELITPVAQSLD
jgi:hypothetical protein